MAVTGVWGGLIEKFEGHDAKEEWRITARELTPGVFQGGLVRGGVI